MLARSMSYGENVMVMVYEINDTILNGKESKQLHTKINFDTVNQQMKKPEFVDSGYEKKSLDSDESAKRNLNNSILAESPNLYKHNGAAMENSGYFIIPRSITSDPRYQGARLKYKHVLITILQHAAFSETTHAIGTEIIKINIGQFCVAERRLVDLCNDGVKFKEDLVDRNIVTRAVQFWRRCQYLSQQVIHGKTLLTVTIPDVYRKEKTQSEPTSEPKVSQNRATKEEREEDKEDNISSQKDPFVPSSFATSLLSEFYSSLFSSIPDFPKESAKKTKTQYQAAEAIGTKAKHDMDLIRKVIAYAHLKDGFWLAHVHSVSYLNKKFNTLVEQLRSQGKKPMNGKAPSRHNNPSFKPKHETPMAYNNKLSFNTEKK